MNSTYLTLYLIKEINFCTSELSFSSLVVFIRSDFTY